MRNRSVVRFGASGRVAGLSVLVTTLVVALLLGPALPAAAAAGYPPLPLGLDRAFLGNLSAPNLAPGASGSLAFSVSDPLPSALDAVVVTLGVYAFNGFPGNATSTSVAGAPILSTPTASGAAVSVDVGALSNGSTYHGSVGVETSASTPNGAYAVRTAVAFTLASNGTAYRLESRGWFNDSLWRAATELPNGSVTLNLSVLGVSGVVPETAIGVAASDWGWLLGAVVAAAVVLVGAGAWVYFRRGPTSRSGAR